MKLTNMDIYNAKDPLKKLMGERLPVKAAYGLAKLAAKVQSQLNIIDSVRKGLFETYGKPNPNNLRNLTIDPEDKSYPAFMEEMGELMNQEVEMVITPVQLPESLEIDAGTLAALDKFVKI